MLFIYWLNKLSVSDSFHIASGWSNIRFFFFLLLCNCWVQFCCFHCVSDLGLGWSWWQRISGQTGWYFISLYWCVDASEVVEWNPHVALDSFLVMLVINMSHCGTLQDMDFVRIIKYIFVFLSGVLCCSAAGGLRSGWSRNQFVLPQPHCSSP